MEEGIVSKIIDGSFVGAGIKKTQAYETNLVETEFNEVRERFWSIYSYYLYRDEDRRQSSNMGFIKTSM